MQYEITFIVKDEATPDEVVAVFEQTGAKLNGLIDMGSKQFAYPIGKLNSGHYYTSEFDCSTDKIAKIEKFLRLKKTLIRFLIVKKIRFPEETSKTALAEIAAKKTDKPLDNKKVKELTETSADKAKDEAKENKKVKLELEEKPRVEKKATDKPAKTTKKTEEKTKPKTTKKAPVKKVSKAELDKQLEEMVKED